MGIVYNRDYAIATSRLDYLTSKKLEPKDLDFCILLLDIMEHKCMTWAQFTRLNELYHSTVKTKGKL